jgi:NAD(P)-dependent dehydrogenase (short-subunit alcohol dehydrogenase family)
MAYMRLINKVAFITGGAQGIGREIARRFSKEGAVLIIADLNKESAEETAEEIRSIGGKADSVLLDVSKEESWIQAKETVVSKYGKIDILVNNAGITKRPPLTELPLQDFDAIMSINVRGPYLGVKHIIPVMQANGGGSIINMSSIAGLIGHKFSGESYVVSKGALTLMTKVVAVKYAKYNIRCNSIHPSTADTPLVQELLKNPERKKERFDEIPLGRLASLGDIANVALFLASDEASFINGVALPVDGGLTAC